MSFSTIQERRRSRLSGKITEHLKFGLFRFSVAWARVEISDGEFDEAALAHYRQVAECIRSHEMLKLGNFRSLEDAARGKFFKAPVWPRGLYHALRRFDRWFPGQEIFIVENGSVPMANGVSRTDSLRSHIAEMEMAMAIGVPVMGYNFWSITSNREWGHPFDPNTDFGLYFVDLDKDAELKRMATDEAEVYREIIRGGSRMNESGGRDAQVPRSSTILAAGSCRACCRD